MSQFMVFKSNYFKTNYPANSHPSTSGPTPSNPVLEFIKRAKNNSESPVKFIENVYQSLCNSVCLIVTSIIFTCLPISMLIIGIIFKNDCPIEPRIPIWLIVFGVIGIIYGTSRIIVSTYVLIKNRLKQKEPSPFTCVFNLFGIFLACWFIAGNVWVFSNLYHVQHDNSKLQSYCNIICFHVSFWSILICWCLIGLAVLFVLGIALFFGLTLLLHICYRK